ncbi:hypothetical protein H2200_008443 [Cladophialophora chaetospira]|uniref:Fungal N-terminal domain-containing protein n=1 Tax=Cladophialophora chaetospira TaxID=386627 RepID=A0AA38X5S7_9EURO|nr:hypothetical protein H2200_008443 [Cladophialophora chaetospira]
MPVGFGFSAGDFISGVLLVKDIIKALDNVSGSSAEYDALRGELRGLERALHLVSNLPPGTCSTIQHTTETCVQACHNIIQAFVRKAAKFDTTLIHAASTSQQNITRPPPWKAALRKVQWALLKKEDVVRVRLEIAAQVAILNTLLNHKQLLASENQDTALTQLHNQMSQQHGRLQQIEALLQVQKQLSEEGKGDLESFNQKLASIQHEMSSTKTIVVLVWRLGRVLFQLMVQLQKWLANPLPAQVLLQRVAILEDALGRTAPLHIEWLNSWEASQYPAKLFS